MDSLDGMLMVPPDRSQILGRALWKLRYVVVGKRSAAGSQKDHQSTPSYSQLVTSSRNNSCSRVLPRLPNEECCLIIFKHRDDSEPVQQWPINSIMDCQVQMVSHRKQGPVLPTLVVTVSDKERKRRSSRAAGFISSSKDATSITLWFRTPPDDNHPTLNDWARFILSKKTPMSPDSPISPQFSNPFSPISRDPSEYNYPRPSSGNQSNRSEGRGLQHKASTHTYSASTRERPLTFSSESTSLRSKRSDVSSPSISNYPGHPMGYPIPGQHYTTVLPTDLPSPITAGEYQGEFIEGWTSAQGRSSTMSSPIRGRDSISSHAQQPSMTATDSSSPPGPRETILDRAFQLRCIPGSENEIPGEEKLSSLARFEALMRDADEQIKQREAAERAQQAAMRSAFEASDSSEAEEEKGSDDTDDDNFADEHNRRTPPLIPPTAQRALHFITSRHESLQSPNTTRPLMPRNHSSFQTDQTTLVQAPTRPHTAHAKSRLNANQRSYSTPQLAPNMAGLDMSSPVDQGSDDGTILGSSEKRQSSTSTKRLSFGDFTKRLSNTSSLLLVQTNTSGGSSRRSSEVDVQPSTVSRPTINPQGPGPDPREHDRDDCERRCSWRGSVGVIANDGGFL